MSWYYFENMLSIEKLNLNWNKQTNFNKLGPLSRLFQIVLLGRGDGKFAWGNFSIGWLESHKVWFWPLEPFSKVKATFCKYWTLIKIKISMICVYKEYEAKIIMMQEQWLDLKISFYRVITWKLLFSGEGTFGGRNKNLVGIFSWWERDE